MKQSKANCTEVEGLLPLFVGGDLEREDAASVGRHIEGCIACAGLLEHAELARRELRRGLAELVDGREPQLWPAIREQLAREGLFREAGDLTPVPALAAGRLLAPGGDQGRQPYNARILRLAGALAASVALIFVIGRNLDVGGQRPATPSLAREHVSPASSSVTAPPSGDLFADAGSPAGLRPVSLGETPLFDQAREDYQRDARSRAAGSLEAGFFIPAPTAPGSEGDLASSFSLQ